MSVSFAPNGTLIFARALMAQPLASSIGPRLRWRSFMNVRITAGPENTKRIPIATSGSFHAGNPLKKPRNVANAAASVPNATLRRAITLASNTGLIDGAAPAGAGAAGATGTVVTGAAAVEL